MLQKRIKTRVRRAQITGAALDAIGQKGFRGLTISAISKKIGMADSNVYRHFKKKDDVIDAIITEIDTNLKKIRQDAIESKKNPTQRLQFIFQKHLNFLESHKGIPKIIFSNDIHSSNQKLSKKIKKVILDHAKIIKDILKQGKENGFFDKDLDIEAASIAFVGLIQSTALQWMLLKQSFSQKTMGEKLWKIYLKGISKQL